MMNVSSWQRKQSKICAQENVRTYINGITLERMRVLMFAIFWFFHVQYQFYIETVSNVEY